MKIDYTKASELERRAPLVLGDLLRRIPALKLQQVGGDMPLRLVSHPKLGATEQRAYRPYMEITVALDEEAEGINQNAAHCWQIYIEVAGQINEKVLQTIKAYTSDLPHAVPLLFVPSLSAKTIETCRSMGVCCADSAGNCWIGLGNRIYIERVGNKVPSTTKDRSLPPLSSPKTENVLRVLLNQAGAPQRVWRLESLAKEANVSLGQAARVKKILDAMNATEEASRSRRVGGFRLTQPEEVLQEWATYVRARNYRPGQEHTFHALDAPQELQRVLTRKIPSFVMDRFALSGNQAAEFYAPYSRSPVFSAYVLPDEIIDMDTLEEMMDMDAVTSGVNVSLTIARDPGVFYLPSDLQENAREKRVIDRKVPVVSPVQTYLDLQRLDGRAREGAQYLLENYLRPRWQKEITSNE